MKETLKNRVLILVLALFIIFLLMVFSAFLLHHFTPESLDFTMDDYLK